VKALGEKIVDRLEPSDGRIGHDLHPQPPQVLHLGVDYALGKPELGDAVDEDSSCLVEGLKDSHLVAHLDEITRDCQPRGARPHDGDALSRRGGRLRDLDGAGLPLVIGHEAFQAPDGDGVPLPAEDAELLALVLLGADPPADGGQAVCLLDLSGGPQEIPFGNPLKEARDVDVHGTPRHAARLLALDAALRLEDGRLGSVAQGNLVEIANPGLRILLRHGLPGDPLFSVLLFCLVLIGHGSRTCNDPSLAVPAPHTSATGS